MPARNSLARKTFVVTSVAVLTVAAFVALWELKVLVALLFLSFIIASAMRPGVEKLARYRVPRIVGVLSHYAVLAGLLALFLWFVVPNLLHQVEHAIGHVPQTRQQLGKAAKNSTGIKHDILVGLQKELKKLPQAGSVVHASIDAGRKAVAIAVYGLRLLQDYLIQPKVMGDTVGMAPLAVLVIVAAVGLLLGGAYVPLAVPFTAVVATLADVLIRGKRPATQEVPTVFADGGDLKEYQEETERKARRPRARSGSRSRSRAK